jgi:hypothetical protein
MNVIKIAFRVLGISVWIVVAMMAAILLSPLSMRDLVPIGAVFVLGVSLIPIFGIRLVQD